jgi:hypothetical protein
MPAMTAVGVALRCDHTPERIADRRALLQVWSKQYAGTATRPPGRAASRGPTAR